MTPMIRSPLHIYVHKLKRARLRRIMRGYIKLKKSGELDRIARVKRALADEQIKLNKKPFSSLIMGDVTENKLNEVSIRQYLLTRAGGYNLNRALLLALSKKDGKVVYHMPRDWRRVLQQNGFDVAIIRSAILWHIFLIFLLLYGCFTILKITYASVQRFNRNASPSKPYAFFSNLSAGNIPKGKHGKKSYDVITWYIKHYCKRKNIELIKHNVVEMEPIKVDDIEVCPSETDALPTLVGWRNILSFLFWGLTAAIITVFDIFRGRWWHALILNQAALAAQARLVSQEDLANEYLFHNSSQTYRPLWTYEAERRGSKITFYFYSTNVEGFKTETGYRSPTYAFRCMTWPRYLVWDHYQADFVRRATGDAAKIEVVGSIWFHDDGCLEIPTQKKRAIAVFDVTPHRYSRYCTFGEEEDDEYYVPTRCNAFLEHILEAAQRSNYVVFLKRKRDIGSMAHPIYRHFIDTLSNKPDIIDLNPDISANKVIAASSLVISIPFTAPALIARELGKASCYYDPFNFIQSDDRAAHGIPIITNREMLLSWINNQP